MSYGLRAALIAAILSATPAILQSQEIPNPYSEYYGTVERVVDGDTFVVRIDLWPGLQTTYSVRARGIEAPELRGANCPQEKLWAEEARAQAEKLYPVGSIVRIDNVELDSFGRAVADVRRWVSDRWKYFAEEMTERDMAVVWTLNDPDIDWCGLAVTRE